MGNISESPHCFPMVSLWFSYEPAGATEKPALEPARRVTCLTPGREARTSSPSRLKKSQKLYH